jgi:hypothetical protein
MSENAAQELEVLRERIATLSHSVQDRANFLRDRSTINTVLAGELDVVVEALDALTEP